jgi:hypothetical protein
MAYYAMELGSDEDFGSEDGDFEPAAESDEEMEEKTTRASTTRASTYSQRIVLPGQGWSWDVMRRICRLFLVHAH